jgi:hypothetical protein
VRLTVNVTTIITAPRGSVVQAVDALQRSNPLVVSLSMVSRSSVTPRVDLVSQEEYVVTLMTYAASLSHVLVNKLVVKYS